MKYLTCAIAPNGGSICIVLEGLNGEQFNLELDKEINTSTYERIFLNDKLLRFNEEQEWILILEKVISETDFSDDFEKELLEKVVSTMFSRK